MIISGQIKFRDGDNAFPDDGKTGKIVQGIHFPRLFVDRKRLIVIIGIIHKVVVRVNLRKSGIELVDREGEKDKFCRDVELVGNSLDLVLRDCLRTVAVLVGRRKRKNYFLV